MSQPRPVFSPVATADVYGQKEEGELWGEPFPITHKQLSLVFLHECIIH